MSNHPHDRIGHLADELQSLADEAEDLAKDLCAVRDEQVLSIQISQYADSVVIVLEDDRGTEYLRVSIDQEETHKALVKVFERLAPDASVNYEDAC